MEILVSHLIETKKDGTRIVKNFFFNEDKTNYLLKSQSYFSKDEKKQAKINYKLNNFEREELISYLLKQSSPNWNLKLSFL